jgi:hypothetical protein
MRNVWGSDATSKVGALAFASSHSDHQQHVLKHARMDRSSRCAALTGRAYRRGLESEDLTNSISVSTCSTAWLT